LAPSLQFNLWDFGKNQKESFIKLIAKIRGIQGTGWDGEKKNIKNDKPDA